MESILQSIKKLLGISSDYTIFDTDIIIHINSVFLILNQLGVGPKEVFAISDDKNTWSEFIAGKKDINAIKSYMAIRVRMLFDPPTNSSLINAMNEQIKELEWRLNVQVDPGEETT